MASAEALDIDSYLPSKVHRSRFVVHHVKSFEDLLASCPVHINE